MIVSGALMDIVVWLRSLGLGKYEAIFRENDIDETVLPSRESDWLAPTRVLVCRRTHFLNQEIAGRLPKHTARWKPQQYQHGGFATFTR